MNKFNMLTYTLVLAVGLICHSASVFAQTTVAVDAKTNVTQQTVQDKKENSNTKKKTFSEVLNKTFPTVTEEKKDSDNPDDQETWLESLISQGTSEIFKTQDEKALAAEKKRIEKVMMNKHSNAAKFDISGIKLRMKPEEIEKILTTHGFRRIAQEKSIPNFIKWRCDELCRMNGVVGFERLTVCARSLAATNGFEYVSHETYNRYATRETLDILYTSTFTDNLSHQIHYKSDLPLFASKASQHVYINNLKIYDFWKKVDEKYGPPDNTTEVKWGLGGKKPYMKATTGNLELVDPILKNLDTSRMMHEDTMIANMPYYNF